MWCPHTDGRAPGPPAVPRRSSAAAPLRRLRGGEQGGVRGVRRHHPDRRGTVDRRGVPGRRRSAPGCRDAGRDRRPAAPSRPCRRRPADHRRCRPHEVPRQGGKWRRQARWTARRRARLGARVPPPAARRAALGRRREDGREAPRPRPVDRRRGGGAGRGTPRLHARAGERAPPARAGPQPRPTAGGGRPTPAVGRGAAGDRSWPTQLGGRRRLDRRADRPRRVAAAQGRADRPDRGASVALRRLHRAPPARTPCRARRPRRR